MSEFDETTLYEIVQFDDGDIGLKHANDDKHEEPLVKIRFSEEAKFFLNEMAPEAEAEVAKAMIEAGLEAVQDLQMQAESAQPVNHSIH